MIRTSWTQAASIEETLALWAYGTRSERLRGDALSDEQHAFVFDEIKTGMAAIEAELESAAEEKPKREPRPRKGFAAHLELC